MKIFNLVPRSLLLFFLVPFYEIFMFSFVSLFFSFLVFRCPGKGEKVVKKKQRKKVLDNQILAINNCYFNIF